MMTIVLGLAAVVLNASQVDEVLSNVERAFHVYVFPDTAAKAVAMLRQNTPRYESINDSSVLIDAVNADLLAVTHDKHIKLHYDPTSPSNSKPGAGESRHDAELAANFGFADVRRLPGNVGYIDLRYFSDDPRVGPTIDAAMTFLTNTNALIIDLRNNGGGSPIALQALEGYFFKYQQQITSLEWRDPSTGTISEDQQFTDSAVGGPLYLDKPLYILTSGTTFSCAEQFAYDLRNLKRATLVGETTGGGANPGDFIRVGDAFAIFMPEGRAFSPVTKTNWEGTGITPDVKVSPMRALVTAYSAALAYSKKRERDSMTLEEITNALANPENALSSPR